MCSNSSNTALTRRTGAFSGGQISQFSENTSWPFRSYTAHWFCFWVRRCFATGLRWNLFQKRKFNSYLSEGCALKYRKKEARRFSNLRASEGLKTLRFCPRYLFNLPVWCARLDSNQRPSGSENCDGQANAMIQRRKLCGAHNFRRCLWWV